MVDDEQIAQPHEKHNPWVPFTNPLEYVSDVDTNTPNIARIYDYHLGGHANFAVDREVGDEWARIAPDQLAYCRHNRGFLWRAVRTLATEHGIDQFLDLGSGVPTVGNVHEIAHALNPDARVAYVDVEPIAVSHARQLLGAAEQHISVTHADVTEPEAVLTAPGVAELLDFSRPIGVLALGILDIIPTADGAGLMSHYRDACPAGSALAVSNGAQLTLTPEQIQAIHALMSDSSTPSGHWRTREQVAELLAGYELLEPGVVPTAAWRPSEPVREADAARSNAYAAVGLLPPEH